MKKRNLKPIFAACLLASALLLGFAACGDKEEEQQKEQSGPTIDPNDNLDNDNEVKVDDLLAGLG